MPVSVLIGHLLLLAAQLSIGVALGWTLWSNRERRKSIRDPQPEELRRALSLLHQMTASISERPHLSDAFTERIVNGSCPGGMIS